MNEAILRKRVADIIDGWVGGYRGSPEHAEILKIYNSHQPLARGYTVKPKDAFCATTVSSAYIEAGISDYTGTECGCEEFAKIAKRLGIWVERDNYIPKIGDACVYDWDDSGYGDCTGHANHIGIVTSVNGRKFVVTEGNMRGGKIDRRSMKVDGKYIRGFIAPDFAAIARRMGGDVPVQDGMGYTVRPGDTLSRIAAEHKTTVGSLCRINGIRNPNIIHPGQRLYLAETEAACAKLAGLGVINSPEYWAKAAASGQIRFLADLLIKAADRIDKTGARTRTPEDGVRRMVDAGVINSPEYWLTMASKIKTLGDLLCALGGAVK